MPAALVLRALLFIASHLPFSFSEAMVKLFDLAVPKLRRTALLNLSMALPEANAPAIADGVFASLARLLYWFARFPRLNPNNIRDLVEYEGFEHYQAAKARGKGVLFATAHLGNWELSAFSHALLTEPMNVVVRSLDNPRLDALVKRYRSLSGNRILDKKDFLRSILQALSKNEPVGILIDQNTLPEHGAFVPFFGIPASTGTTFAKLAAKTGAAVIPGYLLWNAERRKFLLHFDPVFPMSGDTTADTAALAAHFESVIRRYPDQWLWLHRRWKSRPPGSPSLY
jgi:KDO2-lipid IV(A) lauroyltransferase